MSLCRAKTKLFLWGEIGLFSRTVDTTRAWNVRRGYIWETLKIVIIYDDCKDPEYFWISGSKDSSATCGSWDPEIFGVLTIVMNYDDCRVPQIYPRLTLLAWSIEVFGETTRRLIGKTGLLWGKVGLFSEIGVLFAESIWLWRETVQLCTKKWGSLERL